MSCFRFTILFVSLHVLSVECSLETLYGDRKSSPQRDQSKGKATDLYLNRWAIEVRGGSEEAKSVAESTGFQYVKQVGTMEQFHLLRHPEQPERASEHAANRTEILKNHKKVHWVEQQVVVKRVKRATPVPASNVPLSPAAARPKTPLGLPNDPWYSKEWYFKKPYEDPRSVWSRGFTGQGVVVAVVDDGVQHTHPDLRRNYDAAASYDFIDNDSDPAPVPTFSDDNSHGTRCAGEIVAEMNGLCIAGVAYNSSFGALRLIGDSETDADEAAALSYKPDHIDIYTNSWGPSDRGSVVSGPRTLTSQAFKQGVAKGRQGKGSIYTWAAGNGKQYGDMCGADGFTNMIETITVTAMSSDTKPAYYAEGCANVMVAVYSSGPGLQPNISTTDINSGCTDQHTGTSAAAPMAAGIIALALEANPSLTWRDVQHMLALTSETCPSDTEYLCSRKGNAAGYVHKNDRGFGLIDSAALVNLARHWVSVPTGRMCTGPVHDPSASYSSTKTFRYTESVCTGTQNEVRYLEHVVATISASSYIRGTIAFDLISPQGTTTTLLTERNRDYNDFYTDWRFTSVALWGENPRGTWTLVGKSGIGYLVSLSKFQLEFHGTYERPAFTKLPPTSTCSSECRDGCVGLASTDCNMCAAFTVLRPDRSFNCVDQCPVGSVRLGSTCQCSHCTPPITSTSHPPTTLNSAISRTHEKTATADPSDGNEGASTEPSVRKPTGLSSTVTLVIAVSCIFGSLPFIIGIAIVIVIRRRKKREVDTTTLDLISNEEME